MTAVARQPLGPQSDVRSAPEPAGFYHRYIGNRMTRTEQRNLSLRLVQRAHDSGLLARMAGSRNLSVASDVLVAAYDTEVLDKAIHGAVTAEQRTPGVPDPGTIAVQLCRHLLQDQRAA